MEEETRQIVFAADLAEDCKRAIVWAIANVFRAGDIAHIVHVAKLKDETPELFAGTVGSSYHYHESTPAQTNAQLEDVKAYIREQIVAPLDSAAVNNQTHLFLEGENAPASDVSEVIRKVYVEVGGDFLIASRSNKTWKERWALGSVAESLSRLPHPLVLVSTALPEDLQKNE